MKYLEKYFKLPNGMTTRLQMIDHPGAVLIVPFISRKEIILLKQYRAVLGKYIFELPAGTIDRNETPLKCAQREVVEETGYRALQWKRLGKIYPVPGYSNEIIYIYRAEGLKRADATMDDDEIIETVVIGKKEINQLFRENKICDAKTICALCMCSWLK